MPTKAVSHVRRAWTAGTPTLNAWLTIPDSFVAEVVARAGFDSVCIDMQHGLIDQGSLVPMLQAIQGAGVAALVRVPWNEPSVLMRVLDAGADGVIVPMISRADEALNVLRACRYPPAGVRSFGPTRAGLIAERPYAENAAEDTLVFVMIETAEALDDLEGILAAPSLTGVYVGPADLSLALGLPPETDSRRPQHVAAIQAIVKACHEHDKVVGLHTATPEFAREATTAGMNFVTIATDTSCLRAELASRLERYRVAGG